MRSPEEPLVAGSAFLLTQLGTHATRAFTERIAALDLTPPQTGLLRAVALAPGRSQQALATQLGTPATRLVALVDGLESRGLLERRRNPDDRRLHAIHLSRTGEALMADIKRVAREHDDALLEALDPNERTELRELLTRIADHQGLTRGVHPGYRTLRPTDTASPSGPTPAADGENATGGRATHHRAATPTPEQSLEAPRGLSQARRATAPRAHR